MDVRFISLAINHYVGLCTLPANKDVLRLRTQIVQDHRHTVTLGSINDLELYRLVRTSQSVSQRRRRRAYPTISMLF